MFDLMEAVAAVAVIAAISLGFVALGLSLHRKALRREVRSLKSELAIANRTHEAISNRLEVVKKDNRELERENGRLKAEKVAVKVAAQPKRDPATGRFLPRAQA